MELSGRTFPRSWVRRDLQAGDLSFLKDFAFFRNRRPPSAVVGRLCERGFLAKTARGRSRMTLKGWLAVLLRQTFARRGQTETHFGPRRSEEAAELISATAVTILVRMSINLLRRYARQTNERRSHLEASQYRTASNVAIISPRPYWKASKSNRSWVELRFVRFHPGGYLGIKTGQRQRLSALTPWPDGNSEWERPNRTGNCALF
jgi:hypothetical protein